MEEFRPANVIEADTELAERLIGGELSALDELTERYARPVAALVAARSGSHPTSVDVFARAWIARNELTPGSDFSPWIGAIAADGLGDADRVWSVAAAVDAIDAESCEVLRQHHVDGADLPDELDRHELRLRRRLAQLGDDDAIVAALSDPIVWTQPSDGLVDEVRAAIGAPSSAGTSSNAATSANAGVAPKPGGFVAGDAADASRHLDGVAEADIAGDDVAEEPGRVARSLRPLIFGLVGAVTVLFVAIIALSAASGTPDPVVFSADLTPTGAVPEVQGGELTATVRDAGVELSLDAPTLPIRSGGRYYEGVFVLGDGTELSVGTFAAAFRITLWGGISLDQVDEFHVVAREVGTEVADIVLKLDIPRP